MSGRGAVHAGDTLLEGRVQFQAFQDATQWAWAAAVSISAALKRDLEQLPRARLLLSGGHTPGPAYDALSRAPIEWDRVDVALVDERWLLPEDVDSNARLVRDTLLRNHAARARFEAITAPGAASRSVDHRNCTRAGRGRGRAGPVRGRAYGFVFPGMRGLDYALIDTR